jgi:ergosteryl-3beta-O-L-aspartate synthase
LNQTTQLNFADAIQLLIDSGWTEEDGSVPSLEGDFNRKAEEALGRLIKEHYHTDCYILGLQISNSVLYIMIYQYADKFPLSKRPFYTMPDSEDSVRCLCSSFIVNY